MIPDFRPPRARDFIGIATGMALAALFVAGSVMSCVMLFKAVP